ncbi:MAG: hypothetical protein OHK0013_38820 [Sandaracinaceae bacterium]
MLLPEAFDEVDVLRGMSGQRLGARDDGRDLPLDLPARQGPDGAARRLYALGSLCVGARAPVELEARVIVDDEIHVVTVNDITVHRNHALLTLSLGG